MLTIALSNLRTRWAAFLGTFAALAVGVSVIATMTLVLAAANSGPHGTPQRFAAVPAVVRAAPALQVKDRWGSTDTVPLAEQPALSPAQLAEYPHGIPDRTFPVQSQSDPAGPVRDGRAGQFRGTRAGQFRGRKMSVAIGRIKIGGPPGRHVPGARAEQGQERLAALVGHGWSSATFAPYRLVAGRAPAARDEIVVTGPASLVGRLLTVHTADATGTYTVSGVIAAVPFERAVFFTDTEAARLSPQVDALALHAPAPAYDGVQVLTGMARHQVDPGAAQDATDLVGLESFMGVAALLAGFVALYVTGSTFALSVAQRRRELALLRATGATPSQLIGMVCAEAALVGATGSAAGCALGMLGGPALARWMTVRGMAPAWFAVSFSFPAVTIAFLAGLVVAVLSVTVASVRAGLVRPVEALREATVERRPLTWVRALAGLVALLCGLGMLAFVVLFPSGATDLKTDVEIVLLLVAAAGLLSPLLIPPLVRMLTMPFTRGAGRMLVRENTLTRLKWASAAVAPLLITVGLAAAVLGSSATTQAAENGELHRQAAHADYVVLPVGAAGLDRPLVDQIRAVPGIDTSALTPTTIFAYQPAMTPMHLEAPMPIPFPAQATAGTAVLNFPVRSGSLAALDDRSIAVDTSWDKRVGDTVKVWLADGTPISLRVCAVLSAGLGDNAPIVTPANAARAVPNRILVRVRPGVDRAAIGTALARISGTRTVPTANWTAAVADRQTEQTRLGLDVLLGIAVVYSALGIANTFLMSVIGRRRELALLRLSGATMRQIIGVTAAESLLLAAIATILAGGVTGLLLAGLHIAYGWGSPIVVPWTTTAAIAGGGALIAVLAAALPVRSLLRGNPAALAGIGE